MTPEDARRDLVGFVRWALEGRGLEVTPWQSRMLEAFARGGGRRAMGGGRMRADGWVKRAADELRRLEREATEDLDGMVLGFDLAHGQDRTVHVCGCGFWSESLEAMANHAIRGHRWPIGDPVLDDLGQGDGHL